MVRELSFLRAGECLIDPSQLLAGEPTGELLRIPIWMYLARTDDALFLIDSGMPKRCVRNPGVFGEGRPEERILPQMEPHDMVNEVLGRQGVDIQDVDALISTHWHFDHAGGNRLFRGKPILVHQAELAASADGSYLPECSDQTLDYRFVEDGFEPAPGLRLLHTPGHTPGHLSLLVEREATPPLLLTIDASYTRRNWDLDIPGAMLDPETGRRSVHRLKDLARTTGADVFFGHDAGQANEDYWRSMMG